MGPLTEERGAQPQETVQRMALMAAGLAALGEGGVLFLPLRAMALEAVKVRGGPFENYPAFVVLFVAAVLAATVRPGKDTPKWVAAGAVAVGLAEAVAFGRHTPGAVAVAVLLAVAVAIRVVALGLRDWRNPVTSSFGWGAGALLLEVLTATSVKAGWEAVLPVIVPVFFLGMLASRAASIRFASGTVVHATGSRWMGPRMWAVLAGALALLMGLGVLLGYEGGPLQGLGRFVSPVIGAIVVVLAWVMSQAIRPFIFVASKFHFDLASWQRFFDRLRQGGPRGGRGPVRPDYPGGTQRLLGFVLLLLAIALMVWLMQRYRKRLRGHAETAVLQSEPVRVAPLPSVRDRVREAVRVRRELPEDTVRRWYAEILLELERKGLPKPGWATPGEYLVDVGRAFPECGSGFVTLTRAYEDVRYGNRRFDRTTIQQLDPHHEFVMEALRKAKKLAPAKEEST